MEAEVGMMFDVNRPAITAFGTSLFMRAGTDPAAGSAERAGRAAGRKMPAVWGSMGNNRRAVTGDRKIMEVDQPEPDGGKDCQEGKDFLESCFRIFRSRRAIADQVNSMAGRKSVGVFFCKLSIAANRFCRLFAILPGGEEGRPGVLFPGTKPETVHKVIIRAKRREILNREKPAQAGKVSIPGGFTPLFRRLETIVPI